MVAYVIKRKDLRYWNEDLFLWTDVLYLSTFYGTEKFAKEVIKESKLYCCEPIKTEINEVINDTKYTK